MSRHGREDKSLYDRLGGIYGIAAVVNLFSEKILDNDLVGTNSPNRHLREWSRNQLDRLPGLKFMRTLWVVDITGGPYKFKGTSQEPCPFSSSNGETNGRDGETNGRNGRNGRMSVDPLNLGEVHCRFQITAEQFEAVVSEMREAMEEFDVPEREQGEVLDAFFAHEHEVVKNS